MKQTIVIKTSMLCLALWCSMAGLCQQVTTVSQALNRVQPSTPPYQNTKFVPFPTLELFPPAVEGISDKLYEDMQCTKFIHANSSEDLAPSLYLKVKLPTSTLTLGALTFGGATDYEVDRLFISDETGNIKSSIDASASLSGIYVKQYKLTSDYKVIVYQLIPASNVTIMFSDLIGKSDKTIQCYRLDTTYHISKDGQFMKENEKKYPVRNYTVEQLTNKNIWDL